MFPAPVPGTRPEQEQTPHDRSDIFDPSEAPPSSLAILKQPEQGIFRTLT